MKLPNNYGSVYNLGGNRRRPWAVKKNGRYVGYAKTRKEAMEILANFNEEGTENSEKTFTEVYQMWLKYRSKDISPHTVTNYKSKYKNFCKPLYDKPFKTIKLKDYLDLLDSIEAENGTKNNLIKFLKVLDKTAYEFDVTNKRYTENIRQVKRERKPFTEEEIKQLWEHEQDEDVDLVLILIYTGLRSGELEKLKIENIKGDFLKAGIKTKAGINRIIQNRMQIAKLTKKTTFLNYTAKQLRVRFKRVMKKLNMDHIPHECRHTLITRLDNAGANRISINLIAGHSSGSVGERVYTHKTLQQLTDTINLLE